MQVGAAFMWVLLGMPFIGVVSQTAGVAAMGWGVRRMLEGVKVKAGGRAVVYGKRGEARSGGIIEVPLEEEARDMEEEVVVDVQGVVSLDAEEGGVVVA